MMRRARLPLRISPLAAATSADVCVLRLAAAASTVTDQVHCQNLYRAKRVDGVVCVSRQRQRSRPFSSSTGSTHDQISRTHNRGADHGWAEVNKRLQSPLAHHLGLPMLLLLHELEMLNELEQDKSQSFVTNPVQLEHTRYLMDSSGEGGLALKEALKEAAENRKVIHEWLQHHIEYWISTERLGETALTRPLAAWLDCLDLLNSVMTSEHGQDVEVEGLDLSGNNDILLRQVANREPVALFEFGRGHDSWWSKVDQGIQYLAPNPLNGNAEKSLNFGSHPLLFATITFGDEGTKVAKVFEDQNKRSNFAIGAFLCWQQDDLYGKKQCMSLLWRQVTRTASGFCHAFSSLVAAALCLQEWHTCAAHDLNYTVLGPNSCKVYSKGKPVVLRSYDTRMRATERKPYMYWNYEFASALSVPGRDETPGNEAALREQVVVTHLAHSNNEMNFGIPETSPSKVEIQNGIFDKSGHFLVIQTPYVGGAKHDDNEDLMMHVAKSPLDFIPIARQLLKLHRLGFAHGDMRCFNIVFDGEENSTLIDFDFSGKVGEVKYPIGYISSLDDGKRIGESGGWIERHHDWRALTDIIFVCHSIKPPKAIGDSTNSDKLELEKSRCAQALKDVFTDDLEATMEDLAGRLINLLTQMAETGWTCEAEKEFMKAIARNQNATGSLDRTVRTPKTLEGTK